MIFLFSYGIKIGKLSVLFSNPILFFGMIYRKNCFRLHTSLYKNNRLFTCLCIFNILLSSGLNAQTDSSKRSYFVPRDFCKYFISDIYSPYLQVQAGAGLNSEDYNLSPSRNGEFVFFNQTDFGGEIPFFLFKQYRGGKLSSKLALSAPLCARVWLDFTEVSTAPVLNTDYTFAFVEMNYLFMLRHRLFKNMSFRLLPVFHESSHLGDEITAYRSLDSFVVQGVDVSYESAEFSVTLNDPDTSLRKNWSFRIGCKALLYPKDGWYSVRLILNAPATTGATRHWLEPYAQVQHQTDNGFLASSRFIRMFSAEFRYRVRYGYSYYVNPGTSYQDILNNEKMEPCLNTYFGWKFNFTKSAAPKFGAFLRAYWGINPYGQFRNIPFYSYYAVSISYQG